MRTVLERGLWFWAVQSKSTQQQRLPHAYTYDTEMISEKNTVYLPIHQSEEDEAVLNDSSSILASDPLYDSKRISKRSNSYSRALPWLLHVILLSISALCLLVSFAITRSSGRSCINKLSEYCKPMPLRVRGVS